MGSETCLLGLMGFSQENESDTYEGCCKVSFLLNRTVRLDMELFLDSLLSISPNG